MMEKQLYNRQYFFIMKISKKNIMYDCVFHTVERSSYMCKKTKEQKFIMLPSTPSGQQQEFTLSKMRMVLLTVQSQALPNVS